MRAASSGGSSSSRTSLSILALRRAGCPARLRPAKLGTAGVGVQAARTQAAFQPVRQFVRAPAHPRRNALDGNRHPICRRAGGSTRRRAPARSRPAAGPRRISRPPRRLPFAGLAGAGAVPVKRRAENRLGATCMAKAFPVETARASTSNTSRSEQFCAACLRCALASAARHQQGIPRRFSGGSWRRLAGEASRQCVRRDRHIVRSGRGRAARIAPAGGSAAAPPTGPVACNVASMRRMTRRPCRAGIYQDLLAVGADAVAGHGHIAARASSTTCRGTSTLPSARSSSNQRVKRQA